MPTSTHDRKRPATGEARKTNQPLKIDRLPSSVKMAIQRLYGVEGFTWQEIEDLSRLPKEEDGFVEWDKLETEVLELFPGRFLPHSSLHRWYDLRIEQVKRSVMERSAVAREVAEAFATSVVEGGSEAVVNAARDTIMNMLAEDSSEGGRRKAAAGLIALAEVMQTARANDIKERRVLLGERALQAKLDSVKQKAGAIIQAVEGETEGSVAPISREEVMQKVREIYGVA